MVDAQTIMAVESGERLKEYLARGRQLKALSSDELMEVYKTRFRTFIDNPSPEAMTPHDDCAAELEIRNLEPRYEGIISDIMRFKALIDAREQELKDNPEQKARADANFKALMTRAKKAKSEAS